MILNPVPPLKTDEDKRRVETMFFPILHTRIIKYHDLFNDTCVKIVIMFILNAIYCGGVQIGRKLASLNDHIKEYLSDTFESFGRRVLISCWQFGFAAMVLRDCGGPCLEPVLLDLTQVHVRYYKPAVGIPEFRFFQLVRKNGGPTDKGPVEWLVGGYLETEITGVTVYILDEPPTCGGVMNSIMSVLEADIVDERTRRLNLLIAESKRANPQLVLQIETKQFSDKTLMPNFNNPDNLNKQTAGADALSNAQQELARRKQVQYMREVNHQGAENYSEKEVQEMLLAQEADTKTLPSGRQYVAAALPEPVQNPIEWKNWRMSTVSLLFQVPMALFSTASTSVAGESGANKTTAGSEQNYMMFNNTVNKHKEQLVKLKRHIYKEIFKPTHVKEYFDEIHKEGKTVSKIPDAKEQVDKRVEDIQISMPGLPDVGVLTALYKDGFLKFESMCQMAGDSLGIAEEHWEKKPQMTIKEMNGILPKPPAVGGGSTSSGAKKKKKASSSSSEPKKKKQKT